MTNDAENLMGRSFALPTQNVEVNIFGGSVGGRFNAFDGSRVSISGGGVGNGFDAFGGSQERALPCFTRFHRLCSVLPSEIRFPITYLVSGMQQFPGGAPSDRPT